MSREKFLELLFDKGQYSCYTKSPRGTRVSHFPKQTDELFCINALHPMEDMDPTEEWHAENKPRRADVNVICYRNFLIEIDNMPIQEQRKYVENLVPFSAMTYSGKRSMHFIISLEKPAADYNEYMDISERLDQLVTNRDITSKNPSRLSRLPGVLRADTGKEQKLIYLGSRIDKAALLDILPKNRYTNYREMPTVQNPGMIPVDLLYAVKNPIKKVLHLGGRNQFFFWLGNRLRDNGYENDMIVERVEQAYANLDDVSGFPLREAYQAARIRQ